MKYFVTGSNGFIGRHLVKELNKDPNNVVTVCSRLKPDHVEQMFQTFTPDIIFHTGAELKDERYMFETNVILTMRFVECCVKYKPKLLVLFGSSSEYGYSDKAMSESDIPNPKTLYAGTKAATAMLAKAWSHHYNIPILFVRPFTVYGEDEKHTKLSQILFDKWKSGSVLELTEGVHDYIYIDDFLDILLNNVIPNFKRKFDIVNIGSGVQTTNFRFVSEFERALQMKFQIMIKNSEEETLVWRADTTRLMSEYSVSKSKMEKVGDLFYGIKRMVDKYLEYGSPFD